MNRVPRISIVVPSFNQAAFIAETLQSLVDQAYPALEVVIQDGGSTDGAVQIAEQYAARYPSTFALFVERDAGQADALNKGFARTSGEIMGFLNSDDTLLPGVLHRVEAEFRDPRKHVVMGRSLFTGTTSRHVGYEHPYGFAGHFEHLAIWKRGYNTIPQPSVFWRRSVWECCGGLDVSEPHALDYELFCRFSRHFRFHCVDELWSTYRIHDASKTSQRSERDVLELAIAASRKHWGPPWSLLRWRCELSHWLYRRGYHGRAHAHAERAARAYRDGRWARAALEFGYTSLYSPRFARDHLFRRWAARRRSQGRMRRQVGSVDE